MTAIPTPASRSPSRWSDRIKRRLSWWLQPQVSSGARDRRDVGILLVAVLIAVAPHFAHLPWWSIALICALWLWRAWLTIARRPPPGRIAMVPLLTTATVLVWLQHGSIIGHEAGVNLLMLLIALKLLELRSRRDLNLVVFLTFFVQITYFLYDQGLLVALLSIGTTLLLFFVLLSINLADTDLPAGLKAKLVLRMFGTSIPLIVALFLLFPRLQVPLFSFYRSETASTGLSDSMAPETISRLIKSKAIAFRAKFTGPVPAPDRLYWRGPVLGRFDGHTWSGQGYPALAPINPKLVQFDRSSAVQYTVTLEPTQRNWVLALELPMQVDGAGFQAFLSSDAQALATTTFRGRVRYDVTSYTTFRLGPLEATPALNQWLKLPLGYNPLTLRFATDLRNQLVDPSDPDPHARDPALVDAVLNHFRRGGYHYTLQPPSFAGRDWIDEFLFQTRLGFCEHYAAAFVVLMRAAGIPARVVTGYQGGEVNPVDGYLVVHQSDAHAWAEVWLRDRGWKRVDPTAVVSPARIEEGEAEWESQLGLGRYRGPSVLGWIGTWRFNFEALENLWNQAVLSYSGERQRSLIAHLGIEGSWRNLSIAFAIIIPTLLAVLAVLSLRHRQVRDPLSELVMQLRARLEQAGLSAPANEGLSDLKRRLAPKLPRDQAKEAGALLGALEDARYLRARASIRPAELRSLRARVRRFRPVLNAV